jgi:type VI secretion system protein ImpC
MLKEPDAPEVGLRPFSLLVLADLACHEPMTEPVNLTAADELPLLLADHGPLLAFQVPDLIGGTKHLDVELSISDFKDFEPRQIIAAVAPLARSMALISRLRAVCRGEAPKTSVQALVEQHADLTGLAQLLGNVQAAAAPARAAAPSEEAEKTDGDATVDRLLQIADMPDEQQQAASAIDRIARAVGGKRKTKAGGRPADRLTAALDPLEELISRQLSQILHHPIFQQAESAWRGLRFLVRRTNLRKSILLDVMHLPRADLQEGLPRSLASAFEAPERAAAPDLVAAAYLLANPSTEAELLQQLAEAAEREQVPLLVSVAGSFVGLQPDAKPPGWSSLFDEQQYVKWSSFRRKDCARWLAPVVNRFLLREPYDGSRESHAGIVEACASDDDYLWGDPLWAVASLVLHSVATTGWPTQIIGQHAGVVTDLPVRAKQDQHRRVNSPVEFLLPATAVDDLARAGFALLAGASNRDTATLRAAPTSFRTDAEQRLKAGALPYQLLVIRVLRQIDAYRATHAVSSVETLRDDLQRLLQASIADSGFGAFVEVTVTEEEVGHRVGVDLRTGRGVLGGAPVELNFLFK